MKKTLLLFFAVLSLGSKVNSQTNVPLWKTLPEAPPMIKAEESGIAPVNDIKMYYAIFNTDGIEPVILLHGGFASSDEWGFEVPLLSKTHKVIIVDSRGHGRSSMSDQPLGYNLMASDVLQLMNFLKIKKASIVGWSDGGIIGLILAMKYPERVNKLFTFGTNYNSTGYKTEPFDSVLAKRFMSRAQANYLKISPTPENFGRLRKTLGKMYSTEPNLNPEELKTIKAPTIIAGGEYDQFFKLEHFRELAHLIPGAKFVMIKNVSHGGPLQDPVDFHKAVLNLLDSK